ncbi:GAF domain-containing protein [Sorangium sp. So ce362]|uniref:GAF domain-containing protein n=1 Tax=Sorangium sp. So ce362 TaxID=3133303 RepID=UPI003F60F901
MPKWGAPGEWQKQEPIRERTYRNEYRYTGPRPHAANQVDELVVAETQPRLRELFYDANGNHKEWRYRATITDEERRSSRGLVRQAIETRQIVRLSRETDAPRFTLLESLEASGASTGLMVPLAHGREVYGTVYVEYGTDGAGGEALRLVAEFADLAGAQGMRPRRVQW